jgi:cytochrome c2
MNSQMIIKKKPRVAKYTYIVSAIMMIMSLNSSAQNGEAIFKQNCAACHSVGKGRLVGPDLQSVTNKRSESWLLNFTKSSQSLIKSGDADAKAIFNEYNQIMMPDFNLPDADLKAIFAYIESKSPAVAESTKEEVVAPEDETPVRKASSASKDEILLGADLFSGKVAFKNGGASCLSCHHVNFDGVFGGGTLAKELTTVHSRMGDAGIMGLLSSPPFPAMTVSYKDRSLTEDEIFNLTAFLSHVDSERIYQQNRTFEGYFLWGGGLGIFSILLIISMIWFNRKKQGVKHDIFKRQTRTT